MARMKFAIEFDCDEAEPAELIAGLRDTLTVIELPNGDSLYLASLDVAFEGATE